MSTGHLSRGQRMTVWQYDSVPDSSTGDGRSCGQTTVPRPGNGMSMATSCGHIYLPSSSRRDLATLCKYVSSLRHWTIVGVSHLSEARRSPRLVRQFYSSWLQQLYGSGAPADSPLMFRPGQVNRASSARYEGALIRAIRTDCWPVPLVGAVILPENLQQKGGVKKYWRVCGYILSK